MSPGTLLLALASDSVGQPLIIRLIIQTILLDPTGAVWTDEPSNVSRLDPSGAAQVDAEHPSRNRKVVGSKLSPCTPCPPVCAALGKASALLHRWAVAASVATPAPGNSVAHALSGTRGAVRQALGSLGGGVVPPPLGDTSLQEEAEGR